MKLYRRSLAVLAVAATPLMWSHIADAANKTYVGANNSDWATVGNWTPSGVPVGGTSSSTPGDNVNITNSGVGFSRTVTFDSNYPSANPLGVLLIDGTSGAGDTLNLGIGTLTADGAEEIGENGSGSLNQSGGANSIMGGNALFVGGNVNSQGTYTLGGSGTTPSLSVSGNEAIGFSGTGNFTQTAGSSNSFIGSSSTLYVGFTATTGVGTYTLNGGTLSNTGGDSSSVAEYVGYGGNGTFNQTGGSNTIGTVSSNKNLVVGEISGSQGSYTMNSNTTTSTLTVNGNETIADNGAGNALGSLVSGSFSQSAGTQSVTGNLIVGNGIKSNGSYSLTGTAATSLTVGGNATLGFLGTATFTLNSASLHVIGNETLGASVQNNGALGGFSGSCTFSQTGGSQVVSGTLTLGAASDINGDIAGGTYTLSNGSGASSLTANAIVIGNGGTGGFTQNATTTVNVTNNLSIFGTPSNGNHFSGYTMAGGQLNVGGSLSTNFLGTFSISNGVLAVTGAESVSGSFSQTGGAHTVGTTSVPTSLVIDSVGSPGASFSLNNSSGNASSLTVNGDEAVGYNSNASFTNTSGTHTVTGSLTLGTNASGSGSYTLSGTGVLNVDTTGSSGSGEYVGYGGTGNFSQTGGTNTVGSSSSPQPLVIGKAANAVGTYTMDNSTGTSTLTVYGNEYVGGDSFFNNDEPSGTFNQNAGTHTVAGTLYVGFEAGVAPQSHSGQGTFNLSGGTLQASAETIGFDYPGVFNQSAGTTNTVTGGLEVGGGGNYSSTYTLSGGALLVGTSSNPSDAFTTPELIDAVFAIGTFIQSGGTHTLGTPTANQNMELGVQSSGSTGTYTINNSAAALTVNGNVYVGGGPTAAGGQGIFNVSAGTVTVTGTLKAWNTSGTAVNFSGGLINVGALDTNGNPASFNWTAGTLNFTSATTIDSNFVLGPLITLHNAMVLASSVSLTNNGQITLAGGALSGTGSLTNNGLITGNGTISPTGAFLNNAEILQSGGTLTLSDPTTSTNVGNIDLSPGLQFTLSAGTTLTNNGTVNVNGGIINGIGTLANASGGTIAGRGNITTTLSNAGGATIIAQGGTLTIPAMVNNKNLGAIQVVAGATLAGAAFSNFGSISGAGAVNNISVANSGTIAAVGGILTFVNPLTNNFGTITAATGSELILGGITGIPFGPGGNDGTIAPNGGTIVFPLLTNLSDGNITGYGVLTTTVGLVNQGTMLLAGGSTTVNGGVNNQGTGILTIQNASVLFTGAVNTFGTFVVTTGGSVTFADGYTGGPISNAVSNSGSFTALATLVGEGNFSNSGTATIGGTQSWVSGTTFTNTAGTATFSSDAGSATSSPLAVVDSGGSVSFSSTEHLASLTIGSGASAVATVSTSRNVIVTGALSVTGSLNLTSNDLIVHNGSLSGIAGEIAAAHGSGNTWWTGTTGITSSSAASSPSTTALGIELNSDGHGGTLLTSFDNQTVTSTDVLIKYTFAGDADLSGTINATDYILIDNGFASQTAVTPLTGWRNGDFNYDGSINGDDYTLIDNAFNTQGSVSFAGETAGAAEMIASNTSQIAAVPEPGSLGLVGVVGMLWRRRRRRRCNFQL